MNTHFWWNKKDSYEDVFSLVNAIETEQSGQTDESIDNYRLYGNMDRVGMDFHNYSSTRSVSSSGNRVRLNIIKSMVDTVTNKIAKNKPRVKYLTSGADASLQKASKQLEKFTDGIFYQTDIYKKGRNVFRDCTIDQNGYLKIFRIRNKIKTERTLPIDLVFDNNECRQGRPSNMYQKSWLPKPSIISMFPDCEAQITNATVKSELAGGYRPSNGSKTPDQLLVIEAWHLPQEKEDGTMIPGKHMICIDNCTLLEEEYHNDYFPFAIMRWSEPTIGWRGSGLASDLRGIQTEINVTLRTIQAANELMGVPRVLIEKTSKIVQQHINNRLGAMVEYQGTKPEFVNAQPIHPDMYNWVDSLIDKAYRISSGISQLDAQAQKPAGLNSGAAIREYNDINTERFITVGQAYEEFYMDAARQMINLAREIEADETLDAKEKVSVQVKGRKYLEEIKWSDINLEEDCYQMQMFPASQLSQTPAGRKQDIEDLINMGVIQREDAADLLNIPDIEGFLSNETAGVRDIKYCIEEIIENGNYTSPESFQNLAYGIKAFLSAYLNYKWEVPDCKTKESRMEFLRQWISEAQQKLTSAAQSVQQLAPMNTGQQVQSFAPASSPPQEMPAQAPPGVIPPGQ